LSLKEIALFDAFFFLQVLHCQFLLVASMLMRFSVSDEGAFKDFSFASKLKRGR